MALPFILLIWISLILPAKSFPPSLSGSSSTQPTSLTLALTGKHDKAASLRFLPNHCRNGKDAPSLLFMNGGDAGDSLPQPKKPLAIKTSDTMSKLGTFAQKNFFLLGMIVAVGSAKLFPHIGKNGGMLRPELFIGNFGVTCIFLLSGLSLEVSELKEAASNYKLNLMVQLITFLAWPFLVGVPLTRGLEFYFPGLLPKPLLDGLLILTTLPTTVNMCIFLTSAAGGSVASSLCNAVISNLFGIFLTPALLFRFFGQAIELPFGAMVIKLCNKVLLPVTVGQLLRGTKMKDVYNNNSKKFKRLQEIILLSIVWNAFCNAFTKGMGLDLHHGIVLLTLLPLLHLGSLLASFGLFRTKMFNFSRREQVAAMFCASHKTLAFGLPLVNTIFEGNSNLAAYCAPIMFIHPLQLVLGSLLVPRLSMYTSHLDDDGDNDLQN